MKLRKVISGGQTGADRTGLEVARELGLETGGTAPLKYITEKGPDPSLKDFGLVESTTTAYPPRTARNVADADATLWFGSTNSPGYRCTWNAARTAGKLDHWYENPTDHETKALTEKYEVINIAGNRKSKNPEVVQMVWDAFRLIPRKES